MTGSRIHLKTCAEIKGVFDKFNLRSPAIRENNRHHIKARIHGDGVIECQIFKSRFADLSLFCGIYRLCWMAEQVVLSGLDLNKNQSISHLAAGAGIMRNNINFSVTITIISGDDAIALFDQRGNRYLFALFAKSASSVFRQILLPP